MKNIPLEININASKIDLSNKNLKSFPEELFRCKNLKKLNLSRNQISNIPIEISKLTRLENLDISENNISILYSKTFELKNLKVLIVNNNKLRRIPKQIGNLKKLKKLSLAGNKITELPAEISELSLLEKLNIANNPFTHFPSEILGFSKLTTLWINNNKFEYLPAKEIIANLKSLEKLYCFSTSRYELDSTDKDYKQLTHIKGNGIVHLHLVAKEKINTFNETLEKNNSTLNLSIEPSKQPIYNSLAKLSTPLANSYAQILTDLQNSDRLSWAGTAHEIREIVSNMLRLMAPDDEVKKESWYKQEADTSSPTQKQRVKFILKKQSAGSKQKEVIELVVQLENLISTLVRATYSRASDAAHRMKGKNEAEKLLRYFEAFAHDLLDVQ